MPDRDDAPLTYLKAASGGDARAADELVPIVYEELRRQARFLMQTERTDHTFQPTALVHEAYLRLVDTSKVDWNDEAHFLAVACRSMRRVLVDYARARGSLKRGGNRVRVSLVDSETPGSEAFLDLLSLDEALEALGEISRRRATGAELKIFAGADWKQIGAVLGIAPKTAEADWYLARAWLQRRLAGEG